MMEYTTGHVYGKPVIGEHCDIGPFCILHECEIGSNVRIEGHCVIGKGVRIGDDADIRAGCRITDYVVIGDGVYMGPGVIILNDKYPPRHQPEAWLPPKIGAGAIINGGVIICPGADVGPGAIVAAGAVVTKIIPANEMWAGLPASKFRS